MKRFLSALGIALAFASAVLAQPVPYRPGPSSPAPYSASNPVPGTAGGTGGGAFQGLTNFDSGHFPNFRLALTNTIIDTINNAGGHDTIINCEADSLTAVLTASSGLAVATNGRVQAPCAILATLFSNAGIPAVMDDWFGDAAAVTHSSSLPAYYPFVTETTGWAPITTLGSDVVGGFPEWNTTTTTSLTTVSRTAEDHALIFYVTGTSAAYGTFTYAVDGGSASAPVNADTGTSGIATVAVSLGSPGIHSLAINRVGAAIGIAGVDFYNSTKSQVRFRNFGISGSTTAVWVATTSGFTTGNQINKAAYAAPLTILNIGTNDWVNTLGASVTSANITTLVGLIQTNAGSDVLLIVPPPSGAAGTPLATQAPYVAAIRALGTSLNLPMEDWNLHDVNWIQSVAWGFNQSGDQYHPTPQGYVDFADWTFKNLSEGTGYPLGPYNGRSSIAALAQQGQPTISSCASCTVGATANALAGSIAIATGLTTGTFNLPSNAFPQAPRAITCSDQSSGVAVACSVTWTSATSATFTLVGTAIGLTTVNYQIVP